MRKLIGLLCLLIGVQVCVYALAEDVRFEADGFVIKVEGSEIVIDLGMNDVRVGDLLDIISIDTNRRIVNPYRYEVFPDLQFFGNVRVKEVFGQYCIALPEEKTEWFFFKQRFPIEQVKPGMKVRKMWTQRFDIWKVFDWSVNDVSVYYRDLNRIAVALHPELSLTLSDGYRFHSIAAIRDGEYLIDFPFGSVKCGDKLRVIKWDRDDFFVHPVSGKKILRQTAVGALNVNEIFDRFALAKMGDYGFREDIGVGMLVDQPSREHLGLYRNPPMNGFSIGALFVTNTVMEYLQIERYFTKYFGMNFGAILDFEHFRSSFGVMIGLSTRPYIFDSSFLNIKVFGGYAKLINYKFDNNNTHAYEGLLGGATIGVFYEFIGVEYTFMMMGATNLKYMNGVSAYLRF